MSSSSWRLSTVEIPEVFADFTIVPLGDDGVASIDYHEAYYTTFGYFAAALQAEERSERVLKLTATCLQMNSANYTVWHHRRECWRAVHTEDVTTPALLEHIVTEFSFAASLGGSNPKNYQIWYHRRAILDEFLIADNGQVHLELWNAEIGYIDSVLSNDSKNYHAWSNRQWLVHKLRTTLDDTDVMSSVVVQSELDCTRRMLTDDVRNNSAWNHRWTVSHIGATPLSKDHAAEELKYAVDQTIRDPHNESSWQYLVALVKEQDADFLELALSMVLPLHEDDSNKFAQAAVVDMLECKVGDDSTLTQAANLCLELAHKSDAIRRSYWESRHRRLEEKISETLNA